MHQAATVSALKAFRAVLFGDSSVGRYGREIAAIDSAIIHLERICAEAEVPAPGTGGPAFLQTSLVGVMNGTGMTLRDWFAGQVAQGYMAHTGSYGLSNGPDSVAERSYQIADALLAERAKAVRS